MKYRVEVEYIPSIGFDKVEWRWRIRVCEADLYNPTRIMNEWYEEEGKFDLDSREEAREHLMSVLDDYLKNLSTDRFETIEREVDE